LHWLAKFSVHLGHVLARYGGFGLFAISFLDSSFLFFPFINDILLLHLASRHADQPLWVLMYAAECTAGSVAGAMAIYAITRKGRRLWRSPSQHKIGRARLWLQRNEFLTILVSSLMPPPLPFKVFPLAAGAFRMDAMRLAVGLLMGRGLRFFLEGFVGMRYGAAAEAHIRHHMGWLSIVTIALIVGGTMLYRWMSGSEGQGEGSKVEGQKIRG
jgi:membrane protein YqaA with SNARE-associated domain